MTTKGIAEAVGKNPATVARWIERTSRKMQEVAAKVRAARQTQEPADYTLEETLAIIAEGMGRNAADIFRANAEAAKMAPSDSARLDVASLVRETVQATVRELVPALVGALRGGPAPVVPPVAALPAPPDLEPREALRKLVEGYARSQGGGPAYQTAWSELYREYGYRYHRDLARAAKNRNQSVLEYAESEDIIGQLYILAWTMFGKKEGAA